MRRRDAIGATVAAAFLGACVSRLSETPPAEDYKARRDAEAAARVRELGRSGDWLIIRGYHASDDLVASLTRSPFSHAAVLDLERDGVVEAEAQGVHTNTIDGFVGKAHRLLLVRPVWADERASLAAVETARALVGRKYDFLGLIGLSVPDQYYCSELTLEVYRPFIRPRDNVTRPVEPGQLLFWGRILYDSGAL